MSKLFQCRLRQSHDAGHTEQIAWIDERGAKAGAVVELIGDGLWTVWSVSDGHMTRTQLLEHQQNHRNSLPSIAKDG